jgi:hypothetical protein
MEYEGASRNLVLDIELQYGDKVTQLATDGYDPQKPSLGPYIGAIYASYILEDESSLLLDMERGAKINVVFTINLPVRDIVGDKILEGSATKDGSLSLVNKSGSLTHEDNLFNSALLTLGEKGAGNVIATNPSDQALSDVAGVTWEWNDDGSGSGNYFELIDPAKGDAEGNKRIFDIYSDMILDAQGWSKAELDALLTPTPAPAP